MAPRAKKRKAEGQREEAAVAQIPSTKRRKATAVTKTSNRATIEMIRRNSRDSPLLSLPIEIREKILLFLIGNRCVHLKLREIRDWALYPNNWQAIKVAQKKSFSHTASEFEENPGISPRKAITTSVSRPERSTDRHESCCMDDLTRREGKVLDLGILSSCRQLYEEAQSVLWVTNTYIFNDRSSLLEFANTLNTAQKRKLSNILIRASIEFSSWALAKDTRSRKYWIPTTTINALKSVKNLELDIKYQFTGGYSRSYVDEVMVARVALDCFRPLQAIDLQQMILHMEAETRYFHDKQDSERENPAIPSIAQEFHSALLDPNGAHIAKKSRDNNRNKWTETEICEDYQKTKILCQAVFKKARRDIERHKIYEVAHVQHFLDRFKATRNQLKDLHSRMYWQVNHYERKSKVAKDRILKWKKTEIRKRELCNKRLSRLECTRKIVDPCYDTFGVAKESSEEEVSSEESGDEESIGEEENEKEEE
ncbi:uncharacterized protein KY384_008860 [Bacidia gigantensis]|uniref:uncharacterized protein n=1 Tax=Bacidia gigantensis TaxID=2732470 RepID=UPI001D04A927|nr:uncharacterized protein KY384_008860 [Bacidia gigantensis]KAG8525216.1 hypothetical protein KY384_008860 [Bacidia gigantensis]